MNYEIILPEFPPLIFHPSVIHTLAPAALVQSLALFFSYWFFSSFDYVFVFAFVCNMHVLVSVGTLCVCVCVCVLHVLCVGVCVTLRGR